MALVPLSNSDLFAIVDDKDFELVRYHCWHLAGKGYARTQYSKGRVCRNMHDVILGINPNEKGELVTDHKNGNKLDNRRENLRRVTLSVNRQNAKKCSCKTSSQYVGVCKHRLGWQAGIYKNKKRIHLGYYESEEDAARAYDKKALKLFGPLAKLNFPIRIEDVKNV